MNQRNQQQRNKDRPSKEKSSNSKERSSRNRRRRRPNRGRSRDPQSAPKADPAPKPVKHIPKRYGVVFYDSFNAAKEDRENLLEKAREVDQLNIVVRAEGPMDDPELLQYGKLYAGAAWALIHDRRVEEGWYNEPH
ncbi:hypothetical protein [Pseudobacteriovorax antillogorgiicola]|uniref:Uncharacterized protein n=1 Tax=Pseudobacteriovorax antillogorgiicola TaxID=1513793 RepID=A0A1Y6C7J8_9BACT|nr:hypothetical protein [Pseudobacteriovorax antillogorgiicola]TCS50720.1 hypothetical protein EDD56_112103 [Pseudobacteriovorax antillogorgiicola]SMF40708.1 hypothetical protein SAMN06296036_112102 [Pseudobacteriovorax antillogorgiicola]